MKKIITAILALWPLLSYAKPVPLDHFYTRVPSKTYNQMAEDKKLMDSNLFYPSMNQNQGGYQGHYLNGLQSYFELFDASKIDQMKYVNGVYVGLGFLGIDPEGFEELYKKFQTGIDCKVTRYDFEIDTGKIHYLICRSEGLRMHMSQYEPHDKNLKLSRLSSAKFFREKANYGKVPTSDEITNIKVKANAAHIKIIGQFLTKFGWHKKNGQSTWCLKNQCVVTIETSSKNPKFENVTFSTTKEQKIVFSYPGLSIRQEAKNLYLTFE